jgi:hypothetical protein
MIDESIFTFQFLDFILNLSIIVPCWREIASRAACTRIRSVKLTPPCSQVIPLILLWTLLLIMTKNF